MSLAYDPRAMGARCDECALCGPGIKPKCVPPKGPLNARVALVGEAPGKNEIIKGEPFVGASGIKLGELLWEAGARRQDFWVTNAALCRIEIPASDAADRFSADAYMKWIGSENKKRKKAAKAAKQPFVPLLDPFTACKPRLLRELKQLDVAAYAAGAPSGVIPQPMGNYALHVLRGVKGITKYRGSVMLPRADDFKELEGT